MPTKQINFAVTEEEHSQITEDKEGKWSEYILELAGPKFERTADDRGRVKLPSEYAGQDVVVRVVEVEEGEDA